MSTAIETASHIVPAALRTDYTSLAYQKAGIAEQDWQPAKGFRHNREVLHRLYYYYQQLYFGAPQAFLWAGLARLTGGQVLFGMNNLVRMAKDPCALSCGITTVAKAIFENLAWQHELFLHDPKMLLAVCSALKEPAAFPFADCWRTVMKGDAESISEGNKMLLRNEQLNTIQPHYNSIKQDPYSARWFWFTRFVMRNIHPYHRRFIFCHPFRDVTRFEHRWQWIEGTRGMWRTWSSLPQAERDRLVGLSNEDLIFHRWG